MKEHSHYIIIKELSSVMNTYKREIIGLNNFYQIHNPEVTSSNLILATEKPLNNSCLRAFYLNKFLTQ
jgi:hypothetical protein